jgi:hypothetical protein
MQTLTLLVDVISNRRKTPAGAVHLYAKKGEKVVIIKDRLGVLIVELRGNRFPVRLQDTDYKTG